MINEINLTHCCRVSRVELTTWWPTTLQISPLLFILKEKGAPIKGALLPEPKEGYDWRRTRDARTQDEIFEWGLSK